VPAIDEVPRPPSGGPAVSSGVCAVCRVPAAHCLCAAHPDDLRYALAQISLVHHPNRHGMCRGCGASAALCGYLALLRRVRAGQAPRT
jgi:hypothetical protein